MISPDTAMRPLMPSARVGSHREGSNCGDIRRRSGRLLTATIFSLSVTE